MFDTGKARKSLPIRLAAASWSSETEEFPVGRFTPAREHHAIAAERVLRTELHVGETGDVACSAPEVTLRASVRGPDVEAHARPGRHGDEHRDRELGDRRIGRCVDPILGPLRRETDSASKSDCAAARRGDGECRDRGDRHSPEPARCAESLRLRPLHCALRRARLRPDFPGLSVSVAAEAVSFCGGPCSPLLPGAVAASADDGLSSSAASWAASATSLPAPRESSTLPSAARRRPSSITCRLAGAVMRSASRLRCRAAPNPDRGEGIAIEAARVVVPSLVLGARPRL